VAETTRAALLEIQASRIPARLDASGDPVPLLEQNRGGWDQLPIRCGFAAPLAVAAVVVALSVANGALSAPPPARTLGHRRDPRRHS